MTKANDWAEHHLAGRVKYGHFEVADLMRSSGRWLEEQRRPLRTIAFNEHGYVIRELLYDLDGYLSQVGYTKYDDNGNRKELLFKNPQGGLVSSLVCEYDEAGRLLECVSTQAHGLIIKQRCRPLYDPAGNKIEEAWFFEDGTLSRKYVYQYYPTGQPAEQVLHAYADDGSLEEHWRSLYDERGNVAETTCFDEQARTIAGPTRYKYNEDGVEIEAATFNLRGELYSTTSYEYEFDAQRNWIRRLEVFKTMESRYEARVITYRTLKYY